MLTPSQVSSRRHLVQIGLRGLVLMLGLIFLLRVGDQLGVYVFSQQMPDITGVFISLVGHAGLLVPMLGIVVLERRLLSWLVPAPKPGCPNCGYPVKNLRSPICPECGTDLRQPAPSR